MMPLVTGRAILLGQLDAVTLDPINGADMGSVLTDDLHVFPDVSHGALHFERSNAAGASSLQGTPIFRGFDKDPRHWEL
jgi:hypothetical protein